MTSLPGGSAKVPARAEQRPLKALEDAPAATSSSAWTRRRRAERQLHSDKGRCSFVINEPGGAPAEEERGRRRLCNVNGAKSAGFGAAVVHIQLVQEGWMSRELISRITQSLGRQEKPLSFAITLMEHLVVPTFFVLDAEQKVLIWNRACERLTDMPAAEVLGTRNHGGPL